MKFAENRFPTLSELDVAAPVNPVLVFNSFVGPAVANTLGRNFFISKGVTVDAAGNIAAGAPSLAALNALRAIQTFDDKVRGTRDAMAYSASVGVTTNVDMGGFVIPGTPNIQDSDVFDTLASWDPFTAYVVGGTALWTALRGPGTGLGMVIGATGMEFGMLAANHAPFGETSLIVVAVLSE